MRIVQLIEEGTETEFTYLHYNTAILELKDLVLLVVTQQQFGIQILNYVILVEVFF